MIRWLLIPLAIALAGIAAAPANAKPSPGPVYATCSDAHEAGVYDIPQGNPAYWDDGDRDDDGYACDSPGN